MTEANTEQLEGVPEMLNEKLIDMKHKLDSVEDIVKLIESKPVKELESELSPLEYAKFNWISIYAINSLFFVYLKNNGVNLKDHPIMSELGRIRSYMTRINEIVQAEESKDENTHKIDKESSARIIKRSLWMNASNKNKTKVSEIVNTTLEKYATESSEDANKNKRANESDNLIKNKKVKFEDSDSE